LTTGPTISKWDDDGFVHDQTKCEKCLSMKKKRTCAAQGCRREPPECHAYCYDCEVAMIHDWVGGKQ